MKNRDETTAQIAAAETSLYTAIAALRTPAEVKQFLEDLCTPTERQAMADRWRVVIPIKEGIPYRTIHEQTGVSVTTIGRVARYLKLGMGGYELALSRLEEDTARR
jgi:TrpR-related protein YerC/YecD